MSVKFTYIGKKYKLIRCMLSHPKSAEGSALFYIFWFMIMVGIHLKCSGANNIRLLFSEMDH